MEGPMSVGEAARVLGATWPEVFGLINSHALRATWVGTRYVILPGAIEEFRRTHPEWASRRTKAEHRLPRPYRRIHVPGEYWDRIYLPDEDED